MNASRNRQGTDDFTERFRENGQDRIQDQNVTSGNAQESRPQQPAQPANGLSARTLDDLIATRDRFLSECFEIESGRRFVIDAQDADDRLGYLRGCIEEIHEEIARRDLEGEPVEPASQPCQANLQPPCALENTAAPSAPRRQRHITSDDQRYLERTHERMMLLDDLARAARQKGDLEQAARCAVEAQAIDRERIAFLDKFDEE